MLVSNRIVADVPTAHPGLGFEDYASALAEAISSADRPQFTVGLYGKWGSGKSSLLRAMQRLLGDAPRVIAVEFDAWRYQRTQEIVLPLLYAVLGEVQRSGDTALAGSVWKLVKAFGMSLGFKIPVVGVEFSMNDIKRAWEEEGSPA
ncbi:MAG: P-loop NTPase fold protein, partial [Mycetocola sp.]